MKTSNKQNLQRETLLKLSAYNKSPLIPLRIEHSEKSKRLSAYINKLVDKTRVYPRHLPTQKNFRWSTVDPPLTNFPRECINPDCQARLLDLVKPKYPFYLEHSWTSQCWSLRDIILPDEDEYALKWDHDNIEGRIGAIILDHKRDLEGFEKNYDLHTITCCELFNYTLPTDLVNPHNSLIDKEWREKYNWQGKDTTQRVLAKNFNHGSRYAPNWRFIYTLLSKLEKYGVTKESAIDMAKRYERVNKDVFERKRSVMKAVQKAKVARSLYDGRRIFFDSSVETGKEGFNHMISATVADYNNETIITLCERYPTARLLHNAHDGNTICFKTESIPCLDAFRQDVTSIIERPISYQGRSIVLTATIKVF